MTKIELIKDTYICDNCKGEFLGSTIKLVPKSDGISMPLVNVYCYNPIQDKIFKMPYDSLTNIDLLIACPLCGQVHLDGFQVKKVL